MSQENVEVVREAFAAFARGGPEALAVFWHAEIEVEVPPGLAETGTYRGREAVLAWMSEWSEAWERIEYTPEEILGNGDTVVVTVLYDGIGKGSGLKIVDRFWYLLRLRDGKIVSIRLYGDRNDALEAAGLRE
jgi:ketosteroid isomerase-like protein